jgi:hypothetical protein
MPRVHERKKGKSQLKAESKQARKKQRRLERARKMKELGIKRKRIKDWVCDVEFVGTTRINALGKSEEGAVKMARATELKAEHFRDQLYHISELKSVKCFRPGGR